MVCVSTKKNKGDECLYVYVETWRTPLVVIHMYPSISVILAAESMSLSLAPMYPQVKSSCIRYNVVIS